jgi:hypothetical protein
MTREQVRADQEASKSRCCTPPDDARKLGQLRRTSGKERAHRDRGSASDSDKWRTHKREDLD